MPLSCERMFFFYFLLLFLYSDTCLVSEFEYSPKMDIFCWVLEFAKFAGEWPLLKNNSIFNYISVQKRTLRESTTLWVFIGFVVFLVVAMITGSSLQNKVLLWNIIPNRNTYLKIIYHYLIEIWIKNYNYY